MRSAILALPLLLALPASAAEDDHSDHLSEVDGLRILHAWTNATDDDDARVFMEIENTGEAEATLIGGAAEIAAEVHLMAMDFKNPGSFEELESLPIPAGSAFPLTPNGVFLELHEVAMPLLQGEEFEMHVLIEPFGEIEIHVEIEAADASDHSHAGHNH